MKFNSSLVIAAVLGFSKAAPAQIESVDLTEQQEAELSELVANLQQYNKDHGLEKRDLSLATRSDLPIVDQVLSLLNDSGLAPIVIRNILLNPALLELSSNATIFLLRLNLIDYTDLFIAIEKSGIVNQLLLATLEDPSTLPGILRLTSELLQKNVIGIYFEVNPPPPDLVPNWLGNLTSGLSSKREEDIETKFANLDTTNLNVHLNEEETELGKRESQLLNELFVSLRESGLVVSVVQSLLTDPALAEPSAQFLINILQSDSIPICDIVHILEDNNILINIAADILTDPEILTAFAQLIIDRVARGLIPEGMVTNITTN